MEHRAGSLSFSHIVMQCAEEGSQFAEINAFEKAYAEKNKQWTNETAKAKHDEMVAKKNEYLKELSKEYPEVTPLDEMSITDQDAGHNIYCDACTWEEARLQQLDDQLVAERTAREATQNYL
ncbi:uncharacterized protein Pyn_19862 [Prunus yedoensis var. nudiflora]|uniref:Uncharacterized protein n=1 Tax=Prunus yedoensis var. nudiflora TaxID=2094558 RepID=A0A314ZWI2_PRUYE|nr:uncharacterized protein Pyn_19862 [Prunus yedoensis var. nudiflora]